MKKIFVFAETQSAIVKHEFDPRQHEDCNLGGFIAKIAVDYPVGTKFYVGECA